MNAAAHRSQISPVILDRTTRSLVRLAQSGSSSRTLNLNRVNSYFRARNMQPETPMFMSSYLNSSIIVKHRLRMHEMNYAISGRVSLTKIIVPFESTDLRMGARTFFVGQRGFDEIIDEFKSPRDDSNFDKNLLMIIDELPSLDPFLVRERLSTLGHLPSREYFMLSEADLESMRDFARKELAPLTGMTLDDVRVLGRDKAMVLAEKILGDSAAKDLIPLRESMGMTAEEFTEGVFCWKGFIYFKWSLMSTLDAITTIRNEMFNTRPMGMTNSAEYSAITDNLKDIDKSINRLTEIANKAIQYYDEHFRGLVTGGQPSVFRSFLLKAPAMFLELGEAAGSLQQVVSFWRFRFPKGSPRRVGIDEFSDMTFDFSTSLSAG
jgi:hypothetical protein